MLDTLSLLINGWHFEIGRLHIKQNKTKQITTLGFEATGLLIKSQAWVVRSMRAKSFTDNTRVSEPMSGI